MVRYGLVFPDGTNDLTIELHCFKVKRTEEQGGVGTYLHAKRAADLLWNNPDQPAARRFIWSPWAEVMLEEMCNNQFLSIAGCASSGKSDTAAMFGILFYLADPHHTLVLCTSTTLREAKRRIWKSMEELWTAVPGLPGKLVSSMGCIKGMNANDKPHDGSGILLIPAEKKKEREAIGKLVGLKQQRVLLIADELPELPESIIHAAQTNLITNPVFQMVAMGNPASHFDAFGVFSEPIGGWGTVGEEDMEWETSRGKCIRFDASDNPNLKRTDNAFPWMPTRKNIDDAEGEYGPDSLLFSRMFKGWWCPAGLEGGVYSEADLIYGATAGLAKFDYPGGVFAAGLDPSFTHGGDRCIVYFGSMGRESEVPVLQFDGFEGLQEDINSDVPRSHQIARQFRDKCVARGILPEHAACDSTGAGGPLLDILHLEWSPKVLGVNFAGQASVRPVSASDNTPAKDRYMNRMSELWYQGKELLRGHQLRNIPMELKREMCARRLSDKPAPLGKIRVETKEDYKKRTGRSPDIADSAFVLVELARERMGLAGGERFQANKGKRKDFNKIMRSYDDIFASNPVNLDLE